jgi:hypothetical protein
MGRHLYSATLPCTHDHPVVMIMQQQSRHEVAHCAAQWQLHVMNWCGCCRVSPLGQRFTVDWASNRYAMNGAAILMLWADMDASMQTGTVSAQDARCAAVKQIHYMAGDNDRGSFVVGFGSNPPQRNHHRNSNCAPWEQQEDKQSHCEKCALEVPLAFNFPFSLQAPIHSA